MITLRLTKHKIASMIHIVQDIIAALTRDRQALTHSLKRAEISAHLFVLEDLSRKLRRKLIDVENRFSDYKFNLSVNEMQAYLLVLYRNDALFNNQKSYHVLTMAQITEPIFKHLLQ